MAHSNHYQRLQQNKPWVTLSHFCYCHRLQQNHSEWAKGHSNSIRLLLAHSSYCERLQLHDVEKACSFCCNLQQYPELAWMTHGSIWLILANCHRVQQNQPEWPTGPSGSFWLSPKTTKIWLVLTTTKNYKNLACILATAKRLQGTFSNCGWIGDQSRN